MNRNMLTMYALGPRGALGRALITRLLAQTPVTLVAGVFLFKLAEAHFGIDLAGKRHVAGRVRQPPCRVYQ
jgi:hypothetical protein